MNGRQLKTAVISLALLLNACTGRPDAHAGLVLQQTIALPGVQGRIDHLAIDTAFDRLFVAEIGNGSVDVIDLNGGEVIKRIDGLKEPQGLAYLPSENELVVSSGGDGTVRFYSGTDFTLIQTVDSLDDADNIRIDPATGNILVGYGSGGLAIIDPHKRAVIATVPLPSHPEGFQIDPQAGRAYVNLPRSLKIAVVDLKLRKMTSTWGATQALENFPMALDPSDHLLAAGFRLPGRFVTFDSTTGGVIDNLPGCGVADDLFFDGRTQRFYMLCGDGQVEIFGKRQNHFEKQGSVVTKPGGRTGLLSADKNLFVAASAQGNQPARILFYRVD